MELTMESLALPKDLYWDGKMEPPTSPSSVSSELFALNEAPINWLYDENFANGIINEDELMKVKNSLELYNDEDLVIELMDMKEDYVLDAKSLPLIDFTNNCIDVAHPNPVTKVQAINNELIDYGATHINSTVLAQLTPPQSPPQNRTSGIVFYQDQQQQQKQLLQQQEPQPVNFNQSTATQLPVPAVYSLSAANPLIVESQPTTPAGFNFSAWQNHNSSSNATISNDIEREIQLVDEIVNIRAQELHDWNDDDDDCLSQSSSIYSATPSQTDSQSSDSSSVGTLPTDDDWLSGGANSSYCSSNGSSPLHQIELQDNGQTNRNSSANLKKRTRAYGRGIEDRKIRKKEQNKNAATRYRQKKKFEMECVLSEEQILVNRNDELKRILAERKHESKYLRKLIREFYQGRKI